jgi:hypothetical protein
MNHDYMPRALLLLLLSIAGCFALSLLPDSLLGHNIRKVDLLADLREQPADTVIETLRIQLEELPVALPDTVALSNALRDSLLEVMNRATAADPSGEHIEDYSVDHSGLSRFFQALRHSRTEPVRIAFLGDSFIEGDILAGDFRNSMQQAFGGHGVGFVPISSAAAQYRSSVTIKAEGWKTFSILKNKSRPYPLSGLLFETVSDAPRLTFQAGKGFATLKSANTLRFIYDRNRAAELAFSSNSSESETVTLPATDRISQHSFTADTIMSGSLSFSGADGLRALGIALEDSKGVTVDNLSIRGHSGMLFDHLDPDACADFDRIRHYDLIILQYGLNVASGKMLDYSWYAARMIKTVRHLQRCFPASDFLFIGVSDRSEQYNGQFKTMPAVLALLHSQRRIAQQCHIPFWNMFGAMGGENSMVKYVEKGWAGKDYTHLTFRGGAELSRLLFNALMLEKDYYDR